MATTMVGVVGYDGQARCLEHAATVSSYNFEVYSTSPGRTCWCGVSFGNPDVMPHPQSVFDADRTVSDVWGDYIERDI